MKKVVFGLIATVMFTLVGNAQESSERLPGWLVLLAMSVDVQMGHNDVINGTYYKCIRDGFCRVRIGDRYANWEDVVDLKDIKEENPFIVINPKNGNLYLSANQNTNRIEFLKEFKLVHDTEIDNSTLEFLNSKIKEINPKANEFKGLFKGMELTPILIDGHYLIQIN